MPIETDNECPAGLVEACCHADAGPISRPFKFQPIWYAFERLVAKRFGADTLIDENTGYASAAGVLARAFRYLRPGAEAEFPFVIYETDFYRLDCEWRPFRDVLTGVPREEEFLREVKIFFEDFCRFDKVVLAGIEEPRTAARRFSAVNFFTLGDNIRINVKNGDLYTEDRRNGGWTLIMSDLLICPSTDFGMLASTLNGKPNPAPNVISRPSRTSNTSAAQRRCEEWLIKYAEADAKGACRHIPRAVLKAAAMKKFSISGKSFDRAWANVAERYPTLSKHGLRPAIRKSNPLPF